MRLHRTCHHNSKADGNLNVINESEKTSNPFVNFIVFSTNYLLIIAKDLIPYGLNVHRYLRKVKKGSL